MEQSSTNKSFIAKDIHGLQENTFIVSAYM